MDFKVKAVSKDEFKEWMSDMENYKAGAKTDLAVEGEKVFKEKTA